MPNSNVVVGAVVAVIVVVAFLGFVGFFGYLHYRNKHPPPPEHKKRLPLWLKILEIFARDFLLEIVGIVMTVLTILGFYQNDWGKLSMDNLFIAYYIFMSLKYALLIVEILLEYKFEEIDDQITMKLSRLGIRSDWKGLLQGIIFIPSLIIDGMLTNAEFFTGNNKNLFTNDGVVLIAIDVLLWLKLVIRLLMNQYSSRGKPPYYIKQFAYALIIHFYTVFLVFLFIFLHQRLLGRVGMNIASDYRLIILLVNALTHTYVCSFSSMMASQIVALDRALRGSAARVKQLKLFIRFLQKTPVGILCTLIVMGYTLYVYISVWIISILLTHENAKAASDDPVQGAMFAVIILIFMFNSFFTLNYGIAFAHRFGGYLNLRSPLPNCSVYAETLNGILGQCSASFRLDQSGQITGGR